MEEDHLTQIMDSIIYRSLKSGDGKFYIENVQFPVTPVTKKMFKDYLKHLLQNGTLSTEKDEIGRIWYSKKQ